MLSLEELGHFLGTCCMQTCDELFFGGRIWAFLMVGMMYYTVTSKTSGCDQEPR